MLAEVEDYCLWLLILCCVLWICWACSFKCILLVIFLLRLDLSFGIRLFVSLKFVVLLTVGCLFGLLIEELFVGIDVLIFALLLLAVDLLF